MKNTHLKQIKIFKELKELGYIHYYSDAIEELDDLPLNSTKRISEQALVLRWFRYEHLLEGLILPQVQSMLAPTPAYFIAVISYKDEKWEEKFNSSNNKDEKNFLHYGTYEEAELACLNKLIEIYRDLN